MLKSLYDYAVSHELVLPAGYVKKTVKAYISLSHDLEYVGIVMGGGEPVACPDVGSLAQGRDKSNVLVEKRSVVLPDEPTPKSKFFLDALGSAAEFEPMLTACVKALENPEICGKIQSELDRMKIKLADRISFTVDNRRIFEGEHIPEWWQVFRQQYRNDDPSKMTLCMITGEPTVPPATSPPIQGLKVVGGHARGDALICFDKDAFRSYGFAQGENAPVSEAAFAGVKGALDELLNDAPILAGMKFVHWFDKKLTLEEDPILSCADLFGGDDEDDDEDEEIPVNEAAERERADKVIKSVESGEKVRNLEDTQYYIMMLTGVNGRVMIRRYEQGNYKKLRESIEQWERDLALCNPNCSANLKSRKLTARLIRLLKYQKSETRIFDRLGKELSGLAPAVVNSIMTGAPLPDTVASRALANIRSRMMNADPDANVVPIPDPIACQWLKVWLKRKNRQEDQLMEEFNIKNPAAYNCGALMAVFAEIQKTAMPDVNAGVIQRYYNSACQTPAMVLGHLTKLSNFHFDKFGSDKQWLVYWYKKQLEQLYDALGNDIPVTLSLEEQSYFALGYYQMSAKLHKKNEKPTDIKEEN